MSVSSRVRGMDYGLFTVSLGLFLFGLAIIGSSSAAMALDKYGNWAYYLIRQAVWGVAGIACAVYFFTLPDGDKMHKLTPWLLGITLFMLYLTLTPLGVSNYGARRWIRIPFTPIRLQPYEFIKMSYIVYLAQIFGRSDIKFNRKLAYTAAVTAVICLALLKQPDMGGTIIILAIYSVILVTAGLNLLWFVPIGAVLVAAGAAFVHMAKYRQDRIAAFLDPWSHMDTHAGYNAVRSLMAIGSGGFFGTGLFRGHAKYNYLPMPHTDYVFSIITEELGFIGGAVVIGAFLFLLWKGAMIAMHVREARHKYLAAGITAMITIQAIINIGASTNSLPAKGTTLPFLSAGGSSLVVNLIGIGILLALSKKAAGGGE